MKTKLVRPVLVESKERTDIWWSGHKMYYNRTPKEPRTPCYQLILISLEDKFEVEDIVCDGIKIMNATPKIVNAQHLIDRREWRKVIATQSQLSPEYIQQFIEEYNKGEVKDVKIVFEVLQDCINCKLDGLDDECIECCPEDSNFESIEHPVVTRPKLTNGYVTIVNTMKAEEKLQQAANSHADNYYDKNDSEQFTHWCNRQSNFIAGAKSPESLEYWKEKEKLYTEEEVKELTYNAMKKVAYTPLIVWQEWFNQHNK